MNSPHKERLFASVDIGIQNFSICIGSFVTGNDLRVILWENWNLNQHGGEQVVFEKLVYQLFSECQLLFKCDVIGIESQALSGPPIKRMLSTLVGILTTMKFVHGYDYAIKIIHGKLKYDMLPFPQEYRDLHNNVRLHHYHTRKKMTVQQMNSYFKTNWKTLERKFKPWEHILFSNDIKKDDLYDSFLQLCYMVRTYL